MRNSQRLPGWLLSLALCLTLFLPQPASAAEIYLTAINDNIPPMTAMPVWSGGTLYVPHSVFDYSSTGIDLGLNTSYIPQSNVLNLYSMRKMVYFDLESGTCYNLSTGTPIDARCIMRNNQPYVPLDWACDYFGLTYSYTALTNVSEGYLIRIKNSDVVLSDPRFIDAAGDLIIRRIREYNQSQEPTPVTPPTPSTPTVPEDPTHVATYLAVRCASWDGVPVMLDALDRQNVFAAFFLDPDIIPEETDLLRRIQGSGHSVGILAQGDNPEAVFSKLNRGAQLLQDLTFTQTTLALVPREQRDAAGSAGWVCWNESLFLNPTSSSPQSFSNGVLDQLSGRTRNTYLTLEGGTNAARVMPTLLRRLEDSHFIFNIPLETKI